MKASGRRRWPAWLIVGGLVVAAGAALLACAYRIAIANPVRRETVVALSHWPDGAPPVRVALLSDLHVAGPDMPPDRLRRIVAQVNAARPDLVLIAGDLVSDKRVATRWYSVADAVAPLADLRAPLGVLAVPGNHDHWRGIAAFRRELPKVGVRLLLNEAASAGPLVIVGVDDEFSGHADVARALAGADRLTGPRIGLTHSPDVAPQLAGRLDLLMAGHTHCGQISLPLFGRLASMSRFGDRYACGAVAGSPEVIVGAGLGTSLLPLRLGEPPDWWLITLRG